MKKNWMLFGVLAAWCVSAWGAVLNNNVAVNNLSATTNNLLNYQISVPAGATNLTITTNSGSGDADL